MIFHALELPDAWIIDLERHPDDFGFVATAWSSAAFQSIDLPDTPNECVIAFTGEPGTIRGITVARNAARLVRCTRGSVYHVIADLRPDSPTYQRWRAIELTADNHRMVLSPPGFAHGYQTLVAGCEVIVKVFGDLPPDGDERVDRDDPALGIRWPLPVTHAGGGRETALTPEVPMARKVALCT